MKGQVKIEIEGSQGHDATQQKRIKLGIPLPSPAVPPGADRRRGKGSQGEKDKL